MSAPERIRARPEFQRVYDQGAKAHGRYMLVIALDRGEGPGRLGVAATRKIGSAVVRNRAKRLARALFRLDKAGAGIDLVVVPRREMLDATFAELQADYRTAVERARRMGFRRAQRPGRARRPGPAQGL